VLWLSCAAVAFKAEHGVTPTLAKAGLVDKIDNLSTTFNLARNDQQDDRRRSSGLYPSEHSSGACHLAAALGGNH
jgi:hypothetical protein